MNNEVEIKFNNQDDIEMYNKYKNVRSESLYQRVAVYLNGKLKLENSVDFQLVSDWVRYDKALKKVLYVFISTLEEYFKSTIILNMKYKNSDFSYLNEPRKTYDLSMLSIVNNRKTFKVENHNVGIFTYFSNWVEVHKEKDIVGFTSEELKHINNLRNNVMHMSFIALPIFGYNRLRKDLKIIKNKLPSDWSEGFIEKIVACQKSKIDKGPEMREKRLELTDFIIEMV
jgi:hypothetical protein